MKYLKCISSDYNGGPVGIVKRAALLEQRDIIEDVIEPYLMQKGLVQRTSRGRILSEEINPLINSKYKFMKINLKFNTKNTDSSGFAYHTAYLSMAERAEAICLTRIFQSNNDVKNKLKIFVVKNKVDFIKPAKLFDNLRYNYILHRKLFYVFEFNSENRERWC